MTLALLAGAAAVETPRALCVLVPHFKDEYWLTVAYGIEQAARRHAVRPVFFEAGGYRARQSQIEQIEACERLGTDAILIGAVSSDHPDLIAALARTAENVPVIALVNELHSQALAARVGVDWRDMGLSVGGFLAARHAPGSRRQRALLLSGPSESGWVAPLEGGLTEALAGSAVEIVAVYRADTGVREQLAALEQALAIHPGADYLIGPAPAIEAAMGLLGTDRAGPAPQLVSTYVSHSVRRGLVGGRVLAAPDDDPQEQGAMAVEVALEAIGGMRSHARIGPRVRIVTRQTAGTRIRLSPAGYFPAIE